MSLSFMQLHYDHQVLLDYLISKDTGIHCAEYLLRCLRMVCDSWPLFKEFSADGKFTNQSSDKRRKIILDSPNFQGRLPSATLENSLPSLQEEYGYDPCISRGSYYKEANDCLLSLKTSIENLHQKNLFLYNPEVLLKRCHLHSTSIAFLIYSPIPFAFCKWFIFVPFTSFV
ncbi:hypothetical protein Patl1_28791 [Pistacia atlantica]|uniref:Uncharacterized protein n=1 Tax=Pistacia atlantica TaxID=434234 RepID=A0ACC1BBZ2_9ROSI|nr:hypothetical protein Patl1_28791 [Pistacia atlantica]